MIKGKDGKWYNRKADMIAAENKANELKVESIEENMVKKTQIKEKKTKAEKTEEPAEQKQPDNSKPYLKRKKMVTDIFKLKEEGKTLDEIASKAGGIAPAYVADVLDKGIEAALQEVRDQYHITEEPEPVETDTTETNTDPKTPKEKKAKVPKEKKERTDRGKITDTQRHDAILEILKDNPDGIKARDIFPKVNDKLNVLNKKTTYYQLLGKMKEANEVMYNEETKLYSVA